MLESDTATRVIEAISHEVRNKLTEIRRERSCIDGSVLLIKVLRLMGCPNAYPLTVGVRILNSAYQRWVEEYGLPKDEASVKACFDSGGALILLGKGAEDLLPEDRWVGHVVVVVPQAFGDLHAVLDLTIIQVHKPEWEINLQPLCLKTGDQFVSGRMPYAAQMNGSLLIYNAYPNDCSFNADGKWLADKSLDDAASNVVWRLAAHLGIHPTRTDEMSLKAISAELPQNVL